MKQPSCFEWYLSYWASPVVTGLCLAIIRHMPDFNSDLSTGDLKRALETVGKKSERI
jgi:hypothetical protein